jgi:hypothetical protein
MKKTRTKKSRECPFKNCMMEPSNLACNIFCLTWLIFFIYFLVHLKGPHGRVQEEVVRWSRPLDAVGHHHLVVGLR